jgi:hypothetical protein
VTAEDVIERGLAAASLLSDPTFQDVIKSLGIECFASFVESKPEDAPRREDTYNLYRGLQAIEGELLQRIHAKEEAVKALDADQVEEDETEGPIYIQGNTDR